MTLSTSVEDGAIEGWKRLKVFAIVFHTKYGGSIGFDSVSASQRVYIYIIPPLNISQRIFLRPSSLHAQPHVLVQDLTLSVFSRIFVTVVTETPPLLSIVVGETKSVLLPQCLKGTCVLFVTVMLRTLTHDFTHIIHIHTLFNGYQRLK